MPVPTRTLPSQLSLEQQQKLAKELLRAFLAGDASARDRIRSVLPDKAAITLADAQHVLAREYGFRSWSELTTRIAELRNARPRPDVPAELRSLVSSRNARAVRTLFERRPEARAVIDEPLFPFDTPPLVQAASWGDTALVRALLEAGADPNRRTDWWAGPFHALHHAQGEVATLLLEAGAVPDACAAASLDRIDLLEDLLDEAPARVHERGGDGQHSGDMDLRTPVHHAVDVGNSEILELLLRAGADPNAPNAYGARPASYVRATDKRREILELLIQYGAQPDDLVTLLLLRRFSDADDLVRREPALLQGAADQPTPLHPAVSRQDAAAASWLIAHGAVINAVRVMGACGVTPLHVAAPDDADEMARILVDAGADRTVRDTRWNSDPLGWAEYLGSKRVRAVLE